METIERFRLLERKRDDLLALEQQEKNIKDEIKSCKESIAYLEGTEPEEAEHGEIK